jgi:tetratricopeptide (TPR) repeat protein
LRQAVTVAPHDTNAWLNLGMALRALKRYDEALVAFGRSAELAPGWVVPPMYLGGVYYDTGRYAEGTALLQAVVRRVPTFAQAHVLLGGFYERAGRLGDAVAAYREAIRLDPRNRQAFQGLGRAHGARGLQEAAVSALDAGLAARPGDPVLQAELAQLYEDAGRREKARPLWEAVASNAEDPELARFAAARLAR